MPTAHFIVRVELHVELLAAAEADLAALDRAMESAGFVRVMAGATGRAFALPRGEYHIAGQLNRQAALDRAKRAAELTGRKCGILVTEGIGFTWVGLAEAQSELLPLEIPWV